MIHHMIYYFDFWCPVMAAATFCKALAGHNGFSAEFAEHASEKSGKSARSIYLILTVFQWTQFFCFLPGVVHSITRCMVSWHSLLFGIIGWLVFDVLLLLELLYRKQFYKDKQKPDSK